MPKTFFIDIDGTIVPNLTNDQIDQIILTQPDYLEELLPGVHHFFSSLKPDDTIIFTTARLESHRSFTEKTLKTHGISYHSLIMGLSCGERVLINDTPNVFYQKAVAVNVLRDTGFGDSFIFDPDH